MFSRKSVWAYARAIDDVALQFCGGVASTVTFLCVGIYTSVGRAGVCDKMSEPLKFNVIRPVMCVY